jgi:glutathione S-transferase
LTKSSWTGPARHIDLPKGEQFSDAFRAINPRSIVPVLDHDGRLIHESSVICEYLDGVSAHNPLMPADPVALRTDPYMGRLYAGIS